MFFAIKPFYIFSAAIIAICLIYIFYISLIYPALRKSKVKTLLNEHASNNNKKIIIVKEKNHGATFKIKIDETIYLAKVVMNSKNCDLQINNIDTWVMYIKNGDTYKCKSLTDMTTFMNHKAKNKIIILANQAKTIKKVINECEMIMVNPSVDVHGVKIYNLNQLEELVK